MTVEQHWMRVAMAAAVMAAMAMPAHTSPAAGKKIYVSGKGKAPITASVAGSSPMSATLVPCANCHGADGRGKPEGGVVPTNITWLELTKPYRAATPNGRRRPAYNEQTFRRAVVEGIDSAGNRLHAAMPRYAISREDLSDLVAYLKVLGGEAVPGVTANAVRVGTIVPDSGPGAAAGAQMAAVLSAYFKEAGAIHGRRIELQAVSPARLDALLQNDPPFALAGGLIVGVDELVEKAVERAGIPLVLPVSMQGEASAENRQRFHLAPGIEAQLRGLLRFVVERRPLPAAGRPGAAGAAAAPLSRLIVVTRDDAAAAVARRVAGQLEKPPKVVVAESSARAAAQLDDASAVVFLDPAATLAGLPPGGKSPLLFLGSLLPEDFFKGAAAYGGRITVALTTTPADLSAGGLAEYRAFAARHAITGAQVASQLSAYAAAKVLVQALKQSGRELTREALRTSLEGLYAFETGVTPPLTFGRGRRIAAPRVHVATIDPKNGAFVPAGMFNIDD